MAAEAGAEIAAPPLSATPPAGAEEVAAPRESAVAPGSPFGFEPTRIPTAPGSPTSRSSASEASISASLLTRSVSPMRAAST